ncbi:monocarboxylate transporter 2-like [Uloborus diversus]|uniref:monocarboxylate transporter 2-like n=1 Tax=Uloborus diversus TaxID=327109 RepID=UPI00240A3BAE|nr:monocarboxylate transporter 2-like [Uloborus diversus]
MGISSAGSGLGTLVFSPLLNWLIYLYFWDGAMMILSGLVLNCVVFSLLYRPINLKKWDPSSVGACAAEENRTNLELARETERDNSKSILASNSVGGKSKSVIDGETSSASRKESTEFNSADGKSKYDIYIETPSSGKESREFNSADGKLKYDIDNGVQSASRRESTEFNSADESSKSVIDNETPSASRKESTGNTDNFSPYSSFNPQTLSDPGLLDRPCVFYHGSVICSQDDESKIEQKDKKAYEHYCLPEVESEYEQKKEKTHKHYYPPGFKAACADMVDFSLLYDPVFLTFAFGNFLMFIGIHIPFVFTAQRALEYHLVSMDQASYLLSVIGISNTVGRLLFCFLSDHISFRKLYVYNVCAAVNGISTILSSSATQYYHVILYCIVFGMMFGKFF